jgi:hypothetical protein
MKTRALQMTPYTPELPLCILESTRPILYLVVTLWNPKTFTLPWDNRCD